MCSRQVVAATHTYTHASSQHWTSTQTIASLYWRPFVASKGAGPRSEIAFGVNQLPCNMHSLNKEYEAMYMTHCDVDERLWLARDPQIQTPSRPLAPATALKPRATPNFGYHGSAAQRGRYLAAQFAVSPSSTPIRYATIVRCRSGRHLYWSQSLG